jgi:hypothetical protein
VSTSFRFALVAITAFLFSLTPSVALAAPAGPLVLRWSELQPVLKGRWIAVHLPDGAALEGKYSSLQADALSMEVTKTSDRAKHPKGETRLARAELAQITLMRHSGSKGRTIGLIAGVAIAAVVAVIIGVASNNEVGGFSSTAAGVAAAGAGGSIGIGYLVGWLADAAGARPERVVQILPDEASR